MADTRRKLGRGLSALLEDAAAARPEQPAGEASELPIELVRPNPDQPRRDFDAAALDELSASVRQRGVLQPILVRPIAEGGYQIIAGERRWRAAQRAGLRTIPALVRALADDDTLEVALVENLQRADLNPLEEAGAFEAMMRVFGRTQEDIASAVGKSRSHIANTLRLLRLPEEVRDHLGAGRLSAGHARALLDHPDAGALAGKVIAQGLSVRQTEALASRKPPRPGRAAAAGPGKGRKDPDTRALESDLEESLGLAVEILDRDGVGEVRIRYASLEQLDEVCRRLSRR